MQDIHAMYGGGGGAGGRVFGDRRLRAHHQQNQVFKCPRCDSSNTKFCYFNNYNLSQPRHFCKSCRRYWTKGGVLRNVPVGGGCRKSKRGSSKQKAAPEKKAAGSSDRKSSSHSSCSTEIESTSYATATTAGVLAATTTDRNHASNPMATSAVIASEVTSGASSRTELISEKFVEQVNFDSLINQASLTDSISPEIGSLLSLISSASVDHVPVEFTGLQSQEWPMMNIGASSDVTEDVKVQGLGSGVTMNENADVDWWQGRSLDGGLAGFDWQGSLATNNGGSSGGGSLFQIAPPDVDQANWSQTCTEWCENDHSLFLP